MSFFGGLKNINGLITFLRRGRKPSPEQAREFVQLIKESRATGKITEVHIEGLFPSVNKPITSFVENLGKELGENGPKMGREL